MSYKNVINSLKPAAGRIYSIPLLGYGARWMVALIKLPRLNHHLRRIDQIVGAVNDGAAGGQASGLATRFQNVETRLDESLRRVNELNDAWRQHVPAFLNAVTSVGAFGHELARQRNASDERLRDVGQRQDATASSLEALRAEVSDSIGKLWHRLEFVRTEILYEMKYSQSAQEATEKISQVPRIVNADKFEEAKKAGLRLNLGSGHVPLEGYVNVDMRDLPGVDVVATVGDLPVEDGSIREIFSAHVLEHFPQEELKRKLLPYWRRLLGRGGVFRAVVPDADAMVAGLTAGEYSFEEFREVFFGGQEYTGDFHFNMFTPASLKLLLGEAGFSNVELVAAGRRNGKCFEFEIKATVE